jgi:hypothetical protein
MPNIMINISKKGEGKMKNAKITIFLQTALLVTAIVCIAAIAFNNGAGQGTMPVAVDIPANMQIDLRGLEPATSSERSSFETSNSFISEVNRASRLLLDGKDIDGSVPIQGIENARIVPIRVQVGDKEKMARVVLSVDEMPGMTKEDTLPVAIEGIYAYLPVIKTSSAGDLFTDLINILNEQRIAGNVQPESIAAVQSILEKIRAIINKEEPLLKIPEGTRNILSGLRNDENKHISELAVYIYENMYTDKAILKLGDLRVYHTPITIHKENSTNTWLTGKQLNGESLIALMRQERDPAAAVQIYSVPGAEGIYLLPVLIGRGNSEQTLLLILSENKGQPDHIAAIQNEKLSEDLGIFVGLLDKPSINAGTLFMKFYDTENSFLAGETPIDVLMTDLGIIRSLANSGIPFSDLPGTDTNALFMRYLGEMAEVAKEPLKLALVRTRDAIGSAEDLNVLLREQVLPSRILPNEMIRTSSSGEEIMDRVYSSEVFSMNTQDLIHKLNPADAKRIHEDHVANLQNALADLENIKTELQQAQTPEALEALAGVNQHIDFINASLDTVKVWGAIGDVYNKPTALAGENAYLGQVQPTIIINENNIPTGLMELLEVNQIYREALERKFGVKILLKKNYDSSATDIDLEQTVAISKDRIEDIRCIMLPEYVSQDVYLPLEHIIALGKTLISGDQGTAGLIYNALTKQNLTDTMWSEFLQTGVLTLDLPAIIAVNKEYYEQLHRQALLALIAA